MEHYAGLDVSLELTSVCVVDAQGEIIDETKVPRHPEDLVRHLRSVEHPITRVGLEAGPLSQWFHAGLVAAGFDTVLLETRHVKAALSAMTGHYAQCPCGGRGRPLANACLKAPAFARESSLGNIPAAVAV